MIAAFLCGLFYGALFLSAGRKAYVRAEMQRRLEHGMHKLLSEVYSDETEWLWGKEDLEPEPIVPGLTCPRVLGDDLDLSKVIHTGFEDG